MKMSQLSRNNDDLTSILNKFGHKLEEIRVRALHNILSKLEHGLICEVDLLQQQHLHIHLLEWFNHGKCPNKQDVLQLIRRLTKHRSGVQQFLEIGAVDFLSKLRADSEEYLHTVIDDILESLLSLPGHDQPAHRRECICRYHQAVQQEPVRDMLGVGPSAFPVRSQSTELTIQHGYFSRPTGGMNSAEGHTNGSITAAHSGVGLVKGLKFSTFPWLPLTPTDRHVLISTNSSLCSPRPSLVLTSCEFVSGVVLRDFPAEIFLQRPSIAKSLLSLLGLKPLSIGDNSITLSAIKCLRELSTLLLLRYKFYHDPSLYCPKQDFGSQTASSASTGSGRDSCSTGQSTLTCSSGSRPSVIGRNEPRVRGDGRDGDSPSSLGSSPVVQDLSASASDTDTEDALVLQFSQLTLPQFVTEVLVHVTPLLKTASTELVVAGVYLLSETLRLMRVAMTPEIWDDGCAAGRALTEKLSESFEILGEVLDYHCHQCSTDDDVPSSTISNEDCVHHRLSMMAVVTLVRTLIQDLVPLEKAKEILPESLSLSLYLAVMDRGLMYCIPDGWLSLLTILQKSLPNKYQLFQKAASICESMKSTCKFIQEMDKKSTSTKDLLAMAEDSLRSLHYHKVLSLVHRFVQLCSDISCSSDGDEELVRQSRKILLRLLAHPKEDVRSQAYAACLKIVKDVINVNEASKARSSAAARSIHFLLDAHILYEIGCFGLEDAKDKVCSQATDLMFHLVKGKLLMGVVTWDAFLQAFVPVLPLLQASALVLTALTAFLDQPLIGNKTTFLGNLYYADSICASAVRDEKTQLSKCILRVFQPYISGDESEEHQVLPQLEKLRGSLRLLFCQDQSVRLQGAKAVQWYLSQESAGSGSLPSLDSYTLDDLADLLLMDHAISLDARDSGPSVFQVEGLLQVFSIFTAANTEVGLQKSALEQIAIILQDTTLHKAFLAQGGLEKVLDCIQQATSVSPGDSSQKKFPMVPACLCILRHILHEDSSLRHQLAHQKHIYFLLIRGILLCYTNARARYHVAHLMVLLLFDEVASLASEENQPSNRFSLPKSILQNYKLPFRCPTIKSHSSHQMELLPKDDPLTKSPAAWRMLRIAWNVAWHGGIEALMGKMSAGVSEKSDTSFNTQLALTEGDELLMRCSHISTSLSQCLRSIQEAASHHAVKVGLWRLFLWLLTDVLMHNGNNTIKDSPDITQSLLQLELKTSLGRFIEVFPVSEDDKILLVDVLSFITLLLKCLASNPSCTDFLHWLGNITCSPQSTPIALLGGAKQEDMERQEDQSQEEGTSAHRSLHKQLVAFLGSYVQCLPLSSEAWRRKTGYLGGSLTHGLLLSLNSADASHFYDLPSLENTLHSLVHVTARPGWSLDWSDGDSLSLCRHLLNSLLEVVSAFHVGRGGTAMSYMGKGVTKSASVCLCHLAHEMSSRAHLKSWSSEWLYRRQRQEGLAEMGLGWLIPLWSYRDPEVRAAGLGIATVLSGLEPGRVIMTVGCQHLPGGLWAIALGVLLDQSECSIVRQQAALLLVNLLSQPFPDGVAESLEVSKEAWTGPLVYDQQTQLSVSGLPGLHVLLDHYDFYHGIAASLCHFYGQASIQPVSIVEDSTVVSSSVASDPSTATTPDVGSSLSNSTTTSPELIAQPILINALQPQVVPSSAESGQQSAAPLPVKGANQGDSSSRCSSSQSQSAAVTSPNTAGRYISVVTPGLISAICRLLQNLLALSPKEMVVSINKEAISKTLIRMMDVGRIASLLHHSSLSCTSEHTETHLQLSSHLTMCCDILQFFQSYKQAQNQCKHIAKVDGTAVFVLGCKLLGLSSTEATGSRIWTQIHNMWESVFSLMLTHVTVLDQAGLQDLMPVIIRHWTLVTGVITHILTSPVASSCRIAALNFLARLLSEIQGLRRKEAKRKSEMQYAIKDDEDEDGCIISDMMHVLDHQDKGSDNEAASGSLLCSVLLQAYDGTLSRSLNGHRSADEKTSIVSALRNLLAISRQAKQTAIKAGLIESIIDGIQHTHAKLNIECLQHSRPIAKKKEEPFLMELISQMALLQNCLWKSQDAKISCHKAGLTPVLLKLWPWSVLDSRLLKATLSLLAAYTASCTSACFSLAQCPPGQSGSSMLHRIVQQIEREKGAVSSLLRVDQQVSSGLFAVLSNAVLSAECRNVLWKSGFLQNFSKVFRQRKPASGKQPFAALWLHLLANLTFFPEGQQMIMRIPEALELLLVFSESTTNDVEYLASLTVHNLCFLSVNKPKLLASEKLLPFFEKMVNSGNKSVQYVGVNALWALLYGSQKAKAILKSSSIFQSLLDVHCQRQVHHLQPSPVSKDHDGIDSSLYQAFSSVIALVTD